MGEKGNQDNVGDQEDQDDQGGVLSIILGMLESLGFLKHSTLLVFQLFSWRLSLCHRLCNRFRLCISVPFFIFE